MTADEWEEIARAAEVRAEIAERDLIEIKTIDERAIADLTRLGMEAIARAEKAERERDEARALHDDALAGQIRIVANAVRDLASADASRETQWQRAQNAESERDEARARVAAVERAKAVSENAWADERDQMRRERDEARRKLTMLICAVSDVGVAINEYEKEACDRTWAERLRTTRILTETLSAVIK